MILPMIRAVRRLLLIAIALAATCSCGQPATFTLSSAMVDPSYSCPPGSIDAPYALHATVEAHNGTSSAVTIRAAAAEMTLEAIKGSWLEKVGDRYETGTVTVEPKAVGAGSSTTLNVTIPSACTNGKAGTTAASHGDYRVTIRVTTSAGTYSITSTNLHRILAGG